MIPENELKSYLGLYQRWGLSIIPIAYKLKKPLIKWEGYQQRRPNHDELIEWWNNYWSNGNQNNIGIICGKVSDNLVVLDYDTEDSWAAFLRQWEDLGITNIYETTPVVKTARGYQVYLRIKASTKSQKFPQWEIRAEGNYIIAPPSIHPSGKLYKFINPDRTEILQIDCLEEIGIKAEKKEINYHHDWVEKALQGVSEGERDNTCISLAGHYKAKGLGYEETITLLEAWAGRCNPTFPKEEVEKCVKSAYGYLEKEAQNQAQALAHAKEVALKWLKLKDTDIIDIALATVHANNVPGDPVWVLIVGPPSSGKSEILRALFDCKGVHPLGGFTANTFASGFQKQTVGLLETLPPQCTLIVKDFGTLLSMRHEDKAMVLQQLREIYDGEYKKEYGNGKTVCWKGRMGLLGATTSAIENYHGVIGELGNRYILCRCSSEEERGEIALKAIIDEGIEDTMRKEITEAFKKVLDKALDPGKVAIPREIQEKLAALANLTSQLRSPVSRNPYDKIVSYLPDIEGPSRLAKAFAKFGKGLSAIRGRLEMNESDYQVIKRLAGDTIPRKRAILIGLLLDDNWWKVKAVATEVSIPTSTASYELEDLALLGILCREADLEEGSDLKQQTPYKYRLKQRILDLIAVTGMFNTCSQQVDINNCSLKSSKG